MSTNVVIRPRLLQGSVTPPPSKSQAHRALIAAFLSGAACRLDNLADSQDIQATRRCLTALSAPGEALPLLDCGESGSTLRFLIPLALVLRGGGRFTGRGRLMERPQGPYFQLFDQMGISYVQTDGLLTLRGALAPGTYPLPGDVSSQFITGLLFALPLLPGDSSICLTSPLQSRGYVDLTLEVLKQFGIHIPCQPQGFLIPGGQRYTPRDMTLEADWSQAGFWYAAIALGSHLDIQGLNPFSAQGDMAIVPAFLKLTQPGDVTLDVSQIPDLVPPLAAMAAVRQGTTRLVNAGRLRMKESDRLTCVTAALTALGARVEAGEESLTFHGLEHLAGGAQVDCCNDHRIAMMAAVAATRCLAPVTLLGAQCVNKSYPDFWEHYHMLGGDLDVLVSG